ncbi:hypothetical protein Back11_26930 [Paenibacillus baekrokdamisoli]|uniref:Uncharacterized protein n=1 Tax=Paenibacillus baekrokdamisoli TaxID=1712516 RepID=A0A3G9JBT6_9BACL|nr:transglutaminase-like domain-containing protein [Paenibacillus baekrokdamisoli]MBB3070342.1 hypothetical protein [Paenibacillus baekrokdamisoli]BBH21348.1 hypothetical protein Back11_26930 [Paenibacillus baekrokdamisoli]
MIAVYRKTFKWLTVGIYHKLSAIMAALLLFEWIRCLGDYWWEETFTIVNGVLFVSTAAIILIPSKFFSSLVQLIFLIGLNVAYSGYTWIPFEGDKKNVVDWTIWLASHVKQLSPFLWISLSIWVVFHFIVWMRNRRLFIIGTISLALLSLLVADSLLTPIHLWDEIAWILFIGLGWLVTSHFSSFKKQHPDNWEHLLEYPVSLFLPILIIITFVMGAGLFVPSIKPILTDPYTAWKEARGEEVGSFVGDKGVSTSPTSSSSGDSRSGYSRNDELLGNGFKFDYSPVMTVSTTKRSYWRGETKAFYNGSGWEESPVEKQEQSDPLEQYKQVLLPGMQPKTTKVEKVEQTFTIIRKDKFPVLFGAGPISTVLAVNAADVPPRLNWLPQSWELRFPAKSRGAYPKSYTIVSEVPVLDEAALRSGAATQPAKDADPIYLQLPSELPERVRELAAELTKDAATPYDKVNKLVSYLRLNYTYTNEPDLSKRQSQDFVDAFLFEMKSGYCDYFSTALAVLTRATGIPARWVKGYSPGSLPYDPERMRMQSGAGIEMNPEGAGTYTVRNSDAHSWVEVYFEGYGWLPFEATAGFSFPYALPEDKVAPVPETNTPVTDDTVEKAASGFHIPVWVFYVTAGVLVLCIAALRFRSIMDGWRRYRMGSDSVNERIVRETNRLIKYGRKKGLDHNEFETVRETMARWSTRLTFLQSEFHAVQGAFEKAMYSSQIMTQEEAERVTATMKVIRERIG